MSWGTINAVMNRLVREGVIAAFKTNLAEQGKHGGLQVAVTAEGAADPARAAVVRSHVAAVLDEVGEDATVTVHETGTVLHPS